MKYIFKESQLKSIIDNMVNEQIGGLQCSTAKLKDIVKGKFNVLSIEGEAKLNGKYYNNESPKPILLMPETVITLCMSNIIYLTNGYQLFFDGNKIGYQLTA